MPADMTRRVAREIFKWVCVLLGAAGLATLAAVLAGDDRWRMVQPLVGVFAAVLSLIAFAIGAVRRQDGAGEPPVVHPRHPDLSRPPRDPADDAALLEAVRQAVGVAPRRFDPATEAYVRMDPPPWKDDGDPLHDVARAQDAVRRDGAVRWAAVVQANHTLFRPGGWDAGASLVVGGPAFDGDTPGLERVADAMFEARDGLARDPQLAEIGRVLEDEMERGMGLPVPSSVTGGRPAWHVAAMLPRAHLPDGFVTGRVLPVWLDPRRPYAVVVPAGFWPEALWARWGGGTSGDADAQ